MTVSAGVGRDDDVGGSVADLGRQLRSGDTSSRDIVEGCLAAADRIDPSLGVYITRFDDAALAAADRADAELAAGIDRGPLHGIPIGVKDVVPTAEAGTTAQSTVLPARWSVPHDAPVVGRLRQGGAIVLGKTTTMECMIGMPRRGGRFPVPVNPWDHSRWPGGTSSGSASGVGWVTSGDSEPRRTCRPVWRKICIRRCTFCR